jgi:lysophospholipase L1-like esterase
MHLSRLLRSPILLLTLLLLSLGLGVIAASPSVARASFTPSQVTGLTLDLDASTGVYTNSGLTTLATTTGNSVGGIADQSGLGNNFVQASTSSVPTYNPTGINGTPSIHFNGTTAFLDGGNPTSLNNLSTGDYSTTFVFRSDYTGGNQSSHIQTLLSKNVYNDSRIWFTVTGRTGDNSYSYFSRYNGIDGGSFDRDATTTPYSTAHVITYTFHRLSSTSGTETIYVDGLLSSQRTGTVPAWDSSSSWRISDTSYGDPSFRFSGDISQEYVYSHVLTDTERQNLEGYAATKAAISSFTLPTSRAIQLYGIGNSLLAAELVSPGQGIFERVVSNIPAIGYADNYGFPGQTTTQEISLLTQQAEPLYLGASTTTVAVFWEITNDMLLGGQTATQAYNNAVTEAAGLTAAGMKTIIMSVLPRSGISEPNRTTVNNLLRADFNVPTSNPLVFLPKAGVTYAAAFYDIGNDPTVGQAGQNANTANYINDSTHLNSNGYSVVAPDLSFAVNLLIDTSPVLFSIAASNLSTTGATITWTTDKVATSQVQYGLTSSYTASSTLNAATTTSHSVILSGLTAGTTYHYSVSSTDVYGNGATSTDQTFTTPLPPPAISGIASSTTQTSATITWTTDQAASSTVNYGVTSAYGVASTTATLVTSHSIMLSGLTAGTTYHFQVGGANSAGTVSTSSDQTFVTAAATQSTPAPSGVGIFSGGGGYYIPPSVSPITTSTLSICSAGALFNTQTGVSCPSISSGIPSAPVVSLPSPTSFTLTLQIGSKNIQVKSLQEYLNAHRFIVSTKGAGSLGNETTTFGPATEAALIKFQKAHGIKPAIGYFGVITRAYIASH